MWTFLSGPWGVNKCLALFSDSLAKEVFQYSCKLKNPARQVFLSNYHVCLGGRELMTFLKVSR